MSRRDLVIVASRILSIWLTVWALTEVSNLPGSVLALLHYLKFEPITSTNLGYVDYMRHLHLIGLAFLITRIVGLSLMARWLYNGGPEIEELLLPAEEETATPN